MSLIRPCVTLITDFGTASGYVGAMKGAIFSVDPDTRLVDITHDITPGAIQEAAFVLAQAYPCFPDDSVHIVVVDPGVGGPRKPILVSTEKHFFVAPDNGVLSYVFQREEVYGAWELNEDQFFRKPVSEVFHGRDIFGPVGAWLFKGIDSARFGTPITEWVKFPIPTPAEVRPQAWKGAILHVDRFGNLITNLTTKEVPLEAEKRPAAIKAITKSGEITRFCRYYAEAEEEIPFMLLGSSGYYEIAIRGGSAAATLNLKAGNEVGVLVKAEFQGMQSDEDTSFLV